MSGSPREAARQKRSRSQTLRAERNLRRSCRERPVVASTDHPWLGEVWGLSARVDDATWRSAIHPS
jgi:hypothetical protein